MKYYVGLDVSLKETSICIVDQDGNIEREGKCLSDPQSLDEYLSKVKVKITLIGLEAGQLSTWLYHGLATAGHPVTCIESRHMAAALKAQRVKTDRNDARGIAHMMRMGWYRQVHVKSAYNQRARVFLNNRRWLIGRKVDLTNQVRGTVRAFGFKLGKIGVSKFEARVYEMLSDDPELLAAVAPMLRARAVLIKEIDGLDRKIQGLVRKDEVCRRLMTVPGIGPLNALAFKTAIDNPHMFINSRAVGAFFGLTPRKYASGETDRDGSITKCGDAMVRAYLYEAAHVLMNRLKKRSCALQRWAARISKRHSEKKARVALARKLAVLMHRIWIDGTEFRWDMEEDQAAKA